MTIADRAPQLLAAGAPSAAALTTHATLAATAFAAGRLTDRALLAVPGLQGVVLLLVELRLDLLLEERHVELPERLDLLVVRLGELGLGDGREAECRAGGEAALDRGVP